MTAVLKHSTDPSGARLFAVAFRSDLYLVCRMNYKPLARFFYANVPGVAAARFAAMDLLASYLTKREFGGILHLSVGSGLVVDVGANRGQSIAALKKFAPQAHVEAFEADPKCSERLISRHRSDPTIRVHECALADHSGSATFYVPRYGWWACDGMGATDLAMATEWLRDPGRMFGYKEAKLKVKEYPIEYRTLDSFNLKPVLIKLHAQGSELAIVKGSRQTIQRHEPAIMCAFPKAELTALLREWGYQPHEFSRNTFSQGLASSEFTFTWFLTDCHTRKLRTSHHCRAGATDLNSRADGLPAFAALSKQSVAVLG
jgi:FkbM family methyltransferase